MRFVLTLVAATLLGACLQAEVYSHPKPKFQITVPDSYTRMTPPKGAPPMHCIFGKNFRDNYSEMVIVVDKPNVVVPPAVQTAPAIAVLDFTAEFTLLSSSVISWNNTTVAIYEISCLSPFFSAKPELLRIHFAHLPTAEGAIRVLVAGLDRDANEVRATFDQVVPSVLAAVPTGAPVRAGAPVPGQQTEPEEDTNSALFVVPLLLLLVGGGVGYFLWQRSKQPQAPPPAYTPPPNRYRDLAPPTDKGPSGPDKHERAPWE